VANSLRELICRVSADTRPYQREMERASRLGSQYFRTVKQGGDDATRSWNTQTAAARTHANAIEANKQAITRYVGIAAGAFGASQLINMADEWTNVSARVRLATESTAEFEQVQARLKDIANATYRNFSEAADQYASTARMMRELGFETRDTLDSAEALGLALVAGGSDAQRGASALSAWTKSVAAGRIDTQKWMTLLEQTPRVAQALADGLGKTTAEMTKMAKDGQLTAQVVVPAITSQMGKLRAEVAAMPTEFRDATVRLRNEMTAWVGKMNETYGATQVMVQGMELVAENIGAIVTVAGAAAFGALAGKMLQVSQAAAAVVAGAVRSRAAAMAEAVAIRDATLAGQLKAQADVRRAQAAMVATRGTAESARASRNYAAALLAERQATLAAAQAQAAYAQASNLAGRLARASLGLLGGPAGLALTVGAVAAGWLVFRDNTDEAAQSLIDFSGAADLAIQKFREMNAAQQAGAILSLSDELEEGRRRISETLSMMGREADFTDMLDTFGPGLQALFRQFDTGKISADQFANSISKMADELAATGQIEEVQRRGLIRYAETIATTATEVERKTGLLAIFTGENQKAGNTAATVAGQIQQQAGALDVLAAAADAAGKKIQTALVTLPGQIERVGKSAAGVARLDVRDWFRGLASTGVNFADTANPVVQQYMQQAEQYIRMQAQLDAAQKGLRAGTAADKAGAKSADQFRDYLAQMERSIALQQSLAEAYGKSESAVAAANRQHEIEEQVSRLGESRRAEIIALIEREAEAKKSATGAEYMANLEREAAMQIYVGEAARARFEIERGGYDYLTEAQQQRLLKLAEERDSIAETAKAAAAYQALAARYATPAEQRRQQLVDDRQAAWLALISGEIDDSGYDKLMERIERRGSQAFSGLSAMADQAARNIQSHFADFLFNPFEDGVKGMARGFSEAIRRMLAEAATSQLFELIGQAMAGYGGQGGWGNFVRGMGTAMTSGGGRAAGGTVQPFKSYDITEHGDPEVLSFGSRQVLLMGSKGGMVTPLMNARGGSGAAMAAPRVEIVNSGPPVKADSAEMTRQPDGSQLLKVFVSAVADNVASGGSVATAMRGRFGLREAV
jgi:tape measure domain-containing protein